MTQNRNLDYGQRIPESLLDSLQEFIGSYVSAGFRLSKASSSSLQVVAGTDNDQVGIAINGRWRYNTAAVTAAHPGGAAGTYDVFVTGSDNSFVAGTPETDNTVYAFGLQIKPQGQVPSTVLYRRVGTCTWDGTQITAIQPLFGDLGNAVVVAPDSQIRNRVATTASVTNVISGMRSGDAADRVVLSETGLAVGSGGGAQDVSFQRDATGPRWMSNVVVNATGFQVSGTALAASHLSDGVTGSGAVVLAASPALTGTPTAPTAATGDSSTAIATTAYVQGQAANTNPLMDGAAAVGVATRWARQDHVHPTDTSRAPLASPTLTGTPAAPTAAADTNTTQLATTAFVLGQAASVAPLMDGAAAVGTSTRFARQDHVHPTDTSRAPLSSPTFTGVPAAPTAAVDTNTTQIATTAFVIRQGYLNSATAASTYAPLASPTLTGTPAAPTAAVDTNTTQIATTQFVINQGYVKASDSAGKYAGGANYGTAFPSSGLSNGYRFTLFWNNQGWDFVYRADIDASHPWVYLGGTSYEVNMAGGSTTSTGWVNTANSNGPPFAGYWEVNIHMNGMYGAQTNAPVAYNGVWVNGSEIFEANSSNGAAGGNKPRMHYKYVASLPASFGLSNYIHSSASDQATSTDGSHIEIEPYRL